MKFPWANISILFLIVWLTVTGFFGFMNGEAERAWILWLHGIGAYALLALVYWKSQIVFDALRRKSRWTRERISFAVMALLLLAVLLLGLLWSFNGPIYALGFSLLSLHIYVAIPVLLLLGWHAWRMRFIRKLPETFGRRLFLGTAVSTIAGLLTWRAAGWAREVVNLPGATRRFTGSYETGSLTGAFPAVSWIADRPAPIDVTTWRLRVDGAVKTPLRFSYDELREMVLDEKTAVLDCTGGWYSEQIWRGLLMARLLRLAEPTKEAASITVRAVSGYQRRFGLDEAAQFLLALDVAGGPLARGHGFPLRLVAVNRRGVEWVKWVTHIEINKTGKIWQLPLPLR